MSDALKPAFDCLVSDTDGAVYLRYVNHKMKREALVPLYEQLVALIGEQQQQVRRRRPTGCRLLFPRPIKNIDGRQSLSSSTYRLAAWPPTAGSSTVRSATSTASPCTSPPHQWRHTLGT